jgi:hypothetical protein
MNIRLALTDMIRRFAKRRESPRPVEKRRCVFILVPLDFHGNGHAKKAEVGQNSIRNGCQADSARTDTFSTMIALDGAAAATTLERELIDDPELNYDLMWTWFLPNPLWLPKRRE